MARIHRHMTLSRLITGPFCRRFTTVLAISDMGYRVKGSTEDTYMYMHLECLSTSNEEASVPELRVPIRYCQFARPGTKRQGT